ncbi:aldo/keto reductase [Streptomyces sp. LN549]|uniref:aldo/keto reductase n=1 Tax=Streptomyces sp. LN549 TaxID=3112979 RepID=UPI00371203AD
MLGLRADDTAIAALGGGRRPLPCRAACRDEGRNGEAGPRYLAPHGHPVYLRSCVEPSLRRLGTERLELCYLHRIDPEVPLSDQLGTLQFQPRPVAAGRRGRTGSSSNAQRRKAMALLAAEDRACGWPAQGCGHPATG